MARTIGIKFQVVTLAILILHQRALKPSTEGAYY